MNNKGFAITTVVYSIIILLSLIMLISLAIVKNEYTDQKEFINEVRTNLNSYLNSKKGEENE